MQEIAGDFGIDTSTYLRVVTRLLSSGCTSIDQFVDYLDDPEDIFVAKALVAYHLAIFESRSALSESKWTSGHWYELLANRLIGGELDSFPLHDIAVITFNYERSLEQYLFDCLTSRFGGRHNESELRTAFLRLPIIHIYGRMGHLPGFGKPEEPERAYERISNRDRLLAAVKGMHMLREIRDDPTLGDREAARKCLLAATGNVIYLGFAYASENLVALDLAKTRGLKAAYGTMKDIGPNDRERNGEINNRLGAYGGGLLSDVWRCDVYTAMLTYPLTIFGGPRP
jgi:hypothetical protein